MNMPTRDEMIAACVAIAQSPDASEETRASARQEILVMLGAAEGQYTVEERLQSRRLLRFEVDKMNAPPAQPKKAGPIRSERAEQKRRIREAYERMVARRVARSQNSTRK